MKGKSVRDGVAWLRLMIALLITGVLASMLAVNAVALSTRDIAIAAKLAELSGAAQSKLVEGLVQNENALQSIGVIRAEASAALLKEPLDMDAARTLGSILVREQNIPAARELFALLGERTLREPVVHLFLMGDAYERKDFQGFQHAAETLLTTRPGMRDQIFTMFASMVDNGSDTRQFRARLATRPEWRLAFFEKLGQVATDSNQVYGLMLDQKRRGAPPTRREMRTWLLNEVGRQNLQILADRWRELQTPSLAASERLLRNGDFEGSTAPPPFDWTFFTSDRSFAEVEPSPSGSGQSLFIELGSRGETTVAMQILDLNQGTYRLSGEIFPITDLSGEPFVVALRCANGRNFVPAAQKAITGAIDRWNEWRWDFVVPSGCRVQELSFGLDAGVVTTEISVYLDNLSLQPRNRK